MNSILRTGDVFIDVGANIGLMSVHGARCVGKNGKVFAIEANPETSKILLENIAINELTNVSVIKSALGSRREQGKIYSNWHVNRGGASLVQPGVDSQAYDIEIERFDTIAASNDICDIRLVKVDIEGFELEALKGFGQVLTRRDAPALIVECTERQSHEACSIRSLFQFVKEINDYRVFKLNAGKETVSRLIQVASEDQLPSHDNIVCLLPKHIDSLDHQLFVAGKT